MLRGLATSKIQCSDGIWNSFSLVVIIILIIVIMMIIVITSDKGWLTSCTARSGLDHALKVMAMKVLL